VICDVMVTIELMRFFRLAIIYTSMECRSKSRDVNSSRYKYFFSDIQTPVVILVITRPPALRPQHPPHRLGCLRHVQRSLVAVAPASFATSSSLPSLPNSSPFCGPLFPPLRRVRSRRGLDRRHMARGAYWFEAAGLGMMVMSFDI